MPVVLRVRGYKFWFYEADLDEPPHVHVSKEHRQAKVWLSPVAVARAGKFTRSELGEITRIIDENRDFLLQAWEKEQGKRDNH